MKSSGGMLRGHLRPIGARSPPFLVIGLLVILGILGFNYWNLTYEYDAILKEIAELQDHLRIAVMKKESSDKQGEALQQTLRQAEQQLGKVKITADQNQRDLAELDRKFELKNSELISIKSQLETCQSTNAKLSSNQEVVTDLQKRIDELESEKSNLSKVNSVLMSDKEELRLKIEELKKSLESATDLRAMPDPFQQIVPAANTAKQPPGQLKPLKRDRVRVHLKGPSTPETKVENTTQLPEKLVPKVQPEFNNENNVLKPPEFNQTDVKEDSKSAKVEKNGTQETKAAEGYELPPINLDEGKEENNSKETNAIEDEVAKQMKPESNAIIEDLKKPLEKPELNGGGGEEEAKKLEDKIEKPKMDEEVKKPDTLILPKPDDAQVAIPNKVVEQPVDDLKANSL